MSETPIFPEGSIEYEEYRAELREELRKWTLGLPPYDAALDTP
jgi:hypothetical protein